MKIVDFQCQVDDCRHVVLDKFEDECPKVCPWCGGENTMRRRLNTGRAATTNVEGVPIQLGEGMVLNTKAEKDAYIKKLRKQHNDPTLDYAPRDMAKERAKVDEIRHRGAQQYRREGRDDLARALERRSR